MAFKHYDVVRAASPSDLAEKLTHKLKEGWQPYGGPVAITPYTLMQAVAIEGDPQVGPSSEPDWFYVVVLAGQSNGMAYGEGLPLPDSSMLRIRALNSWRPQHGNSGWRELYV
ncbi:phage protein YjhS encoded within prophage CP-933O [Escherichia coli]|uniref:Phage protein YjhS encoded within prophage CP-933O n=1 Tax=Escherichia coli TaxID=562 RepID=A0A376ZEE6_ECOLX|nr:phage protein YjhS encoded within prophage CP-933O [Escherichia coli]